MKFFEFYVHGRETKLGSAASHEGYDGSSSPEAQILCNDLLPQSSGIKYYMLPCIVGQYLYEVEDDKEEIFRKQLTPIQDSLRQLGCDSHLVALDENRFRRYIEQSKG